MSQRGWWYNPIGTGSAIPGSGIHEPVRALHGREELCDLSTGSDHGESLRALGSHQPVEVCARLVHDLFLEENQGRTRLILGSGRHLARHRQVVEKRHHLSDTDLAWVRMAPKGEEPVHPVLIRLFRAACGVSAPPLRKQRLTPYRLCVATRNRALAMRLRWFSVARERCWRHLPCHGRMIDRQSLCGRLPRGPIQLLRPRHRSDAQPMRYRLSRLARVPIGHATCSAQRLQGIGDLLRRVIREPLRRNRAERVFGSDDRPSDSRWRHPLHRHVCHITIPKTILCISLTA